MNFPVFDITYFIWQITVKFVAGRLVRKHSAYQPMRFKANPVFVLIFRKSKILQKSVTVDLWIERFPGNGC